MTEPAMRRKVVVALDGSPAAMSALPIAKAIGAQLDADVEALSVTPVDVPGAVLSLHQESAALAERGIAVATTSGDPAARIIAATNDPAVALVVVTTHGRAVEPGRGFGSVAEEIIRATTTPLLLVCPEAEPPPGGILHRLLLPLDGTPTTARALGPVTALARRLGASLDLLYVAGEADVRPTEPGSMGAPRYLDQPQHEWPAWKREIIDRLSTLCAECPPDVPVRAFLHVGDVATEIVRFAAEHAEDAVILVRRSRFEHDRAHVLRAVLAQTPCPVLLLGIPPK